MVASDAPSPTPPLLRDLGGEPDALSLTPDTDLLAHRELWSTQACSVDRALGVVGTRSAMLLLREAFYGTTRFQDFAQRVGITEAAAATRLRELVEEGLLAKKPYRQDGARERMGYQLTAKGRDLLPAVIALMQWGDTWLTASGVGPLRLLHDGCGEPVGTEVRCHAGHQVVMNEIQVRPGK